MSLKTFHIIFVLLCIVAADMFGAWAVFDYRQSGNTTNLVLGIASFVFGLGMIAYGAWFVRKLTRAHLE